MEEKCYEAINDDLNSPILISYLFDGIKYINSVKDGKEKISEKDKTKLIEIYNNFVIDILGLKKEEESKTRKRLIFVRKIEIFIQ